MCLLEASTHFHVYYLDAEMRFKRHLHGVVFIFSFNPDPMMVYLRLKMKNSRVQRGGKKH